MASNLGTVFVEISLDDRTYKQKLSETLTSTEATAKGIETSWKALGTKSSELFDAQRRAAENAYTLIKNSAATTSNDILRAEEAKNAKILALNKAQFGEQQSLLDKFKANWLTASVAIGAAMMAVAKAREYIDEGAKAMQAEESFKRTADAAGESSERIIEAMKRAAAGTVDDSDIMQKAVKGMILGLSGDQMISIMEAARVSARVAGEDVKTAYEGITDAIATGMPKALKKYGLITKEEMATVNAALKAGIDDVDLYTIAMLNAAIQAEKMGEMTGNSAEFLQTMKAHAADTAETIGKYLIVALQKTYGAFQWVASGALTAASAFPKFMQWVSELSAYVQNKLGNKEMAGASEKEARRMEGVYKDMTGAAGELADKAVKNMVGQENTARVIDRDKIARLEKEKRDTIAALKAKTDAAKNADKIHKDILQSETAANKEAYESALIQADHYVKMQKLNGMNELNYTLETIDKKTEALDTWYDRQAASIDANVVRESEKQAKLTALDAEYSKSWDKLQSEREEKTIEVTEFQMKAYQSMITWTRMQDADQMEFERLNYGERVKIDAEAWDKRLYYQRLTGEETEEINSEMLQVMIDDYETTFVGGWKKGLLEMEQAQKSWGDVAYESFKGLNTAMSTTFATVFEDVYKGKLQGLGDYSTMIWDGMRAAFFKAVADMAAQKIMISFAASWASSGMSALGVVDKLLGLTGIISTLSKEAAESSAYTWATNTSALTNGWAQGGLVPGYATGGNSPLNDTVPAWLSPGEFVVPRTGVNADTREILEYIRKFGKAPGYSGGGYIDYNGVPFYDGAGDGVWSSMSGWKWKYGSPYITDPLTGTKYDFDAYIRDSLSGADSGGVPWVAQSPGSLWTYGGDPGYHENYVREGWVYTNPQFNNIPASELLSKLIAGGAPTTDVRVNYSANMGAGDTRTSIGGAYGDTYSIFRYDELAKTLALSGSYDNSTPNQATGAPWMNLMYPIAMLAAAYTGGMSLGTMSASDIAAVEAAAAAMSGTTAAGAITGSTGALVYGSAEFLAAANELGLSEEAAMSLADKSLGGISALDMAGSGSSLIRLIANQVIKAVLSKTSSGGTGGIGDGVLSLALAGMDTGNIGSILGNYIKNPLSARNGMDYIPRDNTLVNTHEGEAILNKGDASQWRGEGQGGGSVHIHLEIDGKEIGYAVADQSKVNTRLIRAIRALSVN